MPKTTQGREIKHLQIKVDLRGDWTWEVKDGHDQEMLCVDDIAGINKHLVKKGVKVNQLACDFPNNQTLCG